MTEVSVLCRRSALEFRISGDPKSILAEAEGEKFRYLEYALKGLRDRPLVGGMLSAIGFVFEAPERFRGKPNPGSRGYVGFELLHVATNRKIKFEFRRRHAPADLMQAISAAFDPEATAQPTALAVRGDEDGTRKPQPADPPAAVGRAEAEGPGAEHAEGQPGGAGLHRRQGHRLPGQARQVEPDVTEPAPAKRKRGRPKSTPSTTESRAAAADSLRARQAEREQRAAEALALLRKRVG